MPPLPPTVNSLPEGGSSNCYGGPENELSYGTDYHHTLDQTHKTVNSQHHGSVAALPNKNKKSRIHRGYIDKNCEPDVAQMQGQYLHHENGFTDLSDCNGSRVRDPHNQQVNQLRGSHPSNALHHEKGMMDLNDCSNGLTLRGRPFNHPAGDPRGDDCGKNSYSRELQQEAPYAHQHSTYNSKISHTSGVKHGHSANRCQETNEADKGYYGDHMHPAQYQDSNNIKISLRHQSQGAYPSNSPVKSRKTNKSDNSKGRHMGSESDSGDGAAYDQWPSNREGRNNLKQQRQDQAIHNGGHSEIVVKHGGADSAQFHGDQHNNYYSTSNSRNGNQQDDMDVEPNHHEIKGSYPMSDRPSEEGREGEEDEEYHGEEGADTQAEGAYAEGNSGQEFDEQEDGDQLQLGNQETIHKTQQQQWKYYNAAKQPKQGRKAAPHRTGGGEGDPTGRKRSATYPPGDRARGGVTIKGESKKKSRTITNGGSHIPIPAGTRQNQKFSTKQASNHYLNTTKLSSSRNEEFSRRLPLPPISSDISQGNVVKKSSTKLASKSQSQVKRPSTQQSKHTL